MIGFFIGRFQPLHKIHCKIIKQLFEENDFVKIAVGSSQYSRTEDNVFNIEERKKMLLIFLDFLLKENKFQNKKYELFFLNDIHNIKKWVEYVKLNCGEFNVVYTGSELTKKLFEEKGYKIKWLDYSNNFSASLIRKKIYELYKKGFSVKDIEKEINIYFNKNVFNYLVSINFIKIIIEVLNKR